LDDQPLRLKRAQDGADRGALHPQQLSQIGMGQGQDVLVNPIP
jgi:hypothetical protein